MASWVNTEAIVADLMRDEEIPSFGKRSEEHIAVHVAILLALALGFFLYHLHRSWRHRPAPPSPLAPHSPHAPLSPSSPPPSRLPRLPVAKLPALRMALLQTAVSLTWYFFTPVCLAFQVVMLVIDAVHLWGERTFIDAMSPECASRNNALLLLPLLGENWHNNHHASPLSATTSVFWYELDLQLALLRLLELLGLVTNIQIVPPNTFVDEAMRKRQEDGSVALVALLQYGLVTALLMWAVWRPTYSQVVRRLASPCLRRLQHSVYPCLLSPCLGSRSTKSV